ncbi:hypothetical protein B0A54_16938 [Friedmanniomyces endolithicus]|uniref:Uncharacterized protein n=1 Tax=Friedmanniomyces endolithicus TaxID=329885 RepID=A0A4U0U1K1_9PEZI|nr:hypothetical protein B0A54_16938 [Friedmanniomyces endolithicus]
MKEKEYLECYPSPTAPQAKKRKAATKEADVPVKKRGRPAKAAAAAAKDDADEPDEPVEDAPATTKTRGRPATKDAANAKSAVTSEGKAAPRKRGRPLKAGKTTKMPGIGRMEAYAPIITLQHIPKTGRNLNGDRFNKSSRTPEGNIIDYRLGYYEQIFTIKRQPVVLTLLNLGKQGKGDDLKAQKQ